MKSLRWLVVLAAAAVFLSGAGVRAAGPLKYTDDVGDALDTRASMDIVSVTYDVRQVNRDGPPSLVVEMELAAPPEVQLSTYNTQATVPGCGFVNTNFTPGTVLVTALDAGPADFFVECGDDGESAVLPAQMRIQENTLTWSIALDGLPKILKAGGTVEEIRAITQIAEPATGIFGSGDPGPLPIDEASTDNKWSF